MDEHRNAIRGTGREGAALLKPKLAPAMPHTGSPGPKGVIERFVTAGASTGTVLPFTRAAVADATSATSVEPRRGSRRHRRKLLFGYVLVENVAYEAPEFATMLILEPLLVWTHRDERDAVVALAAGGPFFVARRVMPTEDGE